MMQSTAISLLALSVAHAPLTTHAFAPTSTTAHRATRTALRYRSLHHGPDIEPLTDIERQGADYTKMAKDKISHYGPGDFTEYADSPTADIFDGGDSEMGLSGDGTLGIRKIGNDVSPHLAWTSQARMDQTYVSSGLSYADELMQGNPIMDAARAQQLENWATQNEIAMANRYMYMNEIAQGNQYQYSEEYGYGDIYEDEAATLAHPVEVGDAIDGTIALKAPMYGVAAYEMMLTNQYMGFAKFRAAFVGNDSNEWSVTPSDGVLKQNEATHFVLRYTPSTPGTSNAYLVIETEDFKKTWKLVGSTGEYEF